MSEVVEVMTNRSWPAVTAARSRFSVPVTLTSTKLWGGQRAMSGLCRAPAWITASMSPAAKAASTTERSATDPSTCVSGPGTTSRPVTA